MPTGRPPIRPPVRALVVGVADPHPIPQALIATMAGLARRAEAAYQDGGYEIQTIRLSTRPVLEDLADWAPRAIVAYTDELQRAVVDTGIHSCSLGPAMAARPDFPLDRIELAADMLMGADALSSSVLLAATEYGVRQEAAVPTARVIRRLAEGTANGLGNFRFGMLACVGPGGPFFPAAYHSGRANLTIGLQSAGVVRAALHGERSAGHPADLAIVTDRVRRALSAAVLPILEVGRRVADEVGLCFGGVDLSPAPAREDSIGAAIEAVCGGPIGAAGTIAAIGAIARGVSSTALPTCGFNGLMLPVLEDAVLARRWAERRLDPHRLLAYSAVCGTGLDAVPLRGDVGDDEVARLLLDVATLAVRWGKPLTARLFPVMGRRSRERSAFGSPHLVDTVVY